MTTTNHKLAWRLATTELRKEHGVAFKANLNVCCNTCVTDEALGLTNPSQPWAYFLSTQGRGFNYDIDGVAHKNGNLVEREYLNYGTRNSSSKELGELITSVFKKHGVEFDWTGEENDAIVILPNGRVLATA